VSDEVEHYPFAWENRDGVPADVKKVVDGVVHDVIMRDSAIPEPVSIICQWCELPIMPGVLQGPHTNLMLSFAQPLVLVEAENSRRLAHWTCAVEHSL
jgi:hypothetical protein